MREAWSKAQVLSRAIAVGVVLTGIAAVVVGALTGSTVWSAAQSPVSEPTAAARSGQSSQREPCPRGAGDSGRSDANAMAASHPDGFGYTWDDSVPFEWLDTGAGTDTGLNEQSEVAGPFSIGFPFRFYENTYTQFWVSKYGLLGFNPDIGYA